jgi:hypothetical protein
VATLRKRTRRVDSYPWDRQDVSNSVQDILTSLEIAEIDVQVRRSLQRILYRKNQFDQDGRGHIILLLRTILESENNGSAALVDTIVCGVSASMDPQWTRTGLRWLEAFDRIPLMSILQTMRELDLFSDDSLGHYFSIAIRNKVSAILEPVGREASKPVRVEPKPPRAISQVAGVEKNIALGLELLALRFEIKHNASFGHQVRRQFDIDAKQCAESMRAAKIYGRRPEVFRRLSWRALLLLASPSMPAAVRGGLEARILAGEAVGGPEIVRARGTLKSGRPRRQAPAMRMAA